ncbi:GreA/GreB family elongation factor [Acinetobacter baumannii]|nr:GreA/GreB family elongation factor [Acinetobacter baumannii]
MPHTLNIPLPSTEQDFESMCSHIFGKRYRCTLPAMYGRRGQKQYGLDILIHENNHFDQNSRIGIQCKHVSKLTYDGLSGDSILKEVAKADSGIQKIKLLVIATTKESDVSLQNSVSTLSDERVKNGLFPVVIMSWNDISNYINEDQDLLKYYLTDNKIINAYYKNIEDNIKYEKFQEALDQLNNNTFTDSFNISEIYKQLLLKAFCYYNLEETDQFTNILNKLEEFEWLDEKYIYLKILNLKKENHQLAIDKLRSELELRPESVYLLILDAYEKIFNKEADIEIDQINPLIQNTLKVKSYFLIKYSSSNGNIEKFNDIYSTLDALEKKIPSIYLAYITSKLNNYYFTKSQLAKEELIQAIQIIEPYQKKFWEIEKPSLKKLAITLLVGTYFHFEYFDKTILLYQFIVHTHISIDNQALNIFFDTFYRNNREDLFIELCNKYFHLLEKEKKLETLEKLIQFKKFDFVENQLTTLELDTESTQYFKALLWTKKLNKDDFKNIIIEEDALSFSSTISLIIIAEKLRNNIDDIELFKKFNQRIKDLDNNNQDHEYYSLYFYQTKQYSDAINYLEKMYEEDQSTKFSYYLFESYIKVKNFKNAKKLFEKHKNFFLSFDNFIDLCHEMAKETLDWTLCEDLISEYENEYNAQGWLWALKLIIAKNLSSSLQFQKLIRDIPENLEGPANTICWIAAQEIKSNLYIKAKDRIKQLWRKNLNNIEVESEIFKVFNSFINLKVSGKHPFFEEDLAGAQIGTAITYKLKNTTETKVIDFEGFSQNDNDFISYESELAKNLIGKKVGDKFIIKGTFGIENEYEVIEIIPLLLYVWRKLLDKAGQANNPFNFVASFEVGSKEEDITEMLSNISKISEQRKESIEYTIKLYKEHPLTIGGLTKQLNIDLLQLVYEWHYGNYTLLRTIDERYISEETEKENLFKDKMPIQTGVFDAFTLLELFYFDVFLTVTEFKKIYLSTNTYQLLIYLQKKYKEESQNTNIKGIMSFDNESPIFIEHDTNHINRIYSDISNLIKHIETNQNFIIEHAYGDGSINELSLIIDGFITTEENSCLRLSKELNIPLISFDARLRALANQLKIQTINMDDLVMSSKYKTTFFAENRFIKSRTISNSYLESRNLQKFILSDFKNFYNFLYVFFKEISYLSNEEAIHYYVDMLKNISNDKISIVLEAVNHINMIFFTFISNQKKEKFDLKILRELLFPYMQPTITSMSSFTETIDEILVADINKITLNLVLKKPTILLKS